MSRYFEMQIAISNFRPARKKKIVAACLREWNFGKFHEGKKDGKDVLWSVGESVLCGGESEDEFAERLAGEVWKANGAFCRVEVTATYLEDMPCEVHVKDKVDYEEWLTTAA